MSDRKVLHPFQLDFRNAIAEAYRAGARRIVGQLATGGGKGVIAANVTYGFLGKPGNEGALIMAPRKGLITQHTEQLWDYGVRHVGVIQGGVKAKASMPVQVATVQALARRKVPNASLVIVDECHFYSELLEKDLMQRPEWKDVLFLGLTATPWRKGMGQAWQTLVQGPSVEQLIADGFLVPYETWGPPSGLSPDLSGIRTVNTRFGLDYQEDGIARAMGKVEIVADVVETFKAKARDRKTMVTCVNKAHARVQHEAFCAAGINTEIILGETPDAERKSIKGRMERGEVEVVVSVRCLDTGTDWTFLDCLQNARPTKSAQLWHQTKGRILRLHPGKTDALVIDHTGSWALDEADELGWTELDDGTRGKTPPRKKPVEAQAKECPKCHFVKPPKTSTCPKCGFQPQRQSQVVTVAGKLEKVGKQKKLALWSSDQKREWYWACRWELLQRGKNPNRAFYLFQAKFDSKPQGYRHLEREGRPEVMADVRARITSSNIRRAKSKSNNTAYAGVLPMTPIIRAATQLLQNGYSPVLIDAKSNIPLTKVIPLRTIPLTLDEIERLGNKNRYRELALAVVNGYRGLWSPDVDTDDRKIIATVWRALPPPNVTRCCNKGYAAFYVDPTGSIGERTFYDASGDKIVEIKAKTIVTIPPSRHRLTGKPYEWLMEGTLLNLRREELVRGGPGDVDRLKQELKVLGITEREPPIYVPPPITARGPVNDKRMQACAEAALSRAVIALTPLKGGRRVSVRDKARSLGKFVHGGFLTDEQVEAELLAACRLNGALAKHGLDRLRKTVRDGIAYAKNDPLPVLEDRPRPYRYVADIKAGRHPL